MLVSALKRLLGALELVRSRGLAATLARCRKELVTNGFKGLLKAYSAFVSDQARYSLWIEDNEPSAEALDGQRRLSPRPDDPLISILVPLYNPNRPFLKEMIESVVCQTYSRFELRLADGSDEGRDAASALEEHLASDSRIRYRRLPSNLGISANTMAAFELAGGTHLALLDQDDALAANALYEVVQYLRTHPNTDLMYSDEDRIGPSNGQRYSPHFKPEWSPDTLRSFNYITHFAIVRRDIFERLGGLRAELDGAQDWDLFLRISESSNRIGHVSRVLYHWRSHDQGGRESSKPYASSAGARAVEEHMKRMGLPGSVVPGPWPGLRYRARYELRAEPLVSIVIPTRDKVEILRRCIDSIRALSTYSRYEIALIENNSEQAETRAYYESLRHDATVRVVEWNNRFNYQRLNNYAVEQARGEIIIFLNNDVHVISPGWIEEMLMYAQRRDVGAVGAKLYYPDGRIQHAGVILGIGGCADHSHRFAARDSPGYFGRLVTVQNYAAVTGACMMLRRSVFEEVGGFDEDYELAWGDVDLCLRVRAAGYSNVWTPYAELFHDESATRGADTTPEQLARDHRERATLLQKWGHLVRAGDPYYNPNLTLTAPSFGVKLPNEQPPWD